MNREAFKQRMRQLKTYREQNPGKGYLGFMEQLAEYKSKEWKENSEMVLTEMLNDNTYNYEQMYNDDPQMSPSEGHFTDTYKTSYHPTFSEESMYSNERSQYNPDGITGGTWDYDNKVFRADKQQNIKRAQEYLNRADPGWKASYKDGGETRKTIQTSPPYPNVYNNTRINPYTAQPLANGNLKPFVDIEDAANFTVLGDAITLKDMGQAVANKDWGGLGWASLGLVPFVPPAVKSLRKTSRPLSGAVFVKGNPERLRGLSSVDRERLNKLLDNAVAAKKKQAARLADDFYLKSQQDAVVARNQMIEALGKDKKYYKRAKEADAEWGTRYSDTYDELQKQYKNSPDNLPTMQTGGLQDGTDGRAYENLTDERAYDVGLGEKRVPSDFTIALNPEGRYDQSVLHHEMSHTTDMVQDINSTNPSPLGIPYWDNKLINGSRNNSTFKDHATYLKDNPNAPISENNYNYLTKGTEEKAFINTMRTDMAHKGIIKKRTQDPTKKQLKEYLSLPDVDNSIKTLSKLYKDTNGIYKATRMMPYLATSGLTAYGAMKMQKDIYEENNKL